MRNPRHLTSIADLPEDTFLELIDRSLKIRTIMSNGGWPDPILAQKLQFNLFYENSTRTNLSFEVAAKRLGAVVSMVPVAASSVHKGESLEDTVLTLAAQGADFLVLRAKEPGTIQRAVDAITMDGYPTAVINAGEGALGHPTQGLLDVSSVLYALDRSARDSLEGHTLSICGDVKHSRVAVSSIEAFARLGATIRMIGPEEFLPSAPPPGIHSIHTDIDEGIAGADIIMALRVQHERLEGPMQMTRDDYHARFGITHDRLAGAHPNAIVMHPGPMNRGVEISAAVADDPKRSLIRSQVSQGVASRMAVLEALHSGTSA